MYRLLQATGKKYLECDVRIDILKAPTGLKLSKQQEEEDFNATP